MRNIQYIFIFFILVLSCKSPEARKPVRHTSGSFIKESATRNKTLYKKEEGKISKIIKENPQNDYITSDSGFWYYYNVKDTLSIQKPEFGDRVTFTYDVRRLNGDIILSETDTGLQEYYIDQSNQDLISGIRDGIKLMKVGETITFLFPSYKAYGYYGIEERLGANVPIQSTITLKSIQTKEEN